MNFISGLREGYWLVEKLTAELGGLQWRIQDWTPIPKVGVPTYYIAIFFPKTAWKWKNLDRGAWLWSPFGSANGLLSEPPPPKNENSPLATLTPDVSWMVPPSPPHPQWQLRHLILSWMVTACRKFSKFSLLLRISVKSKWVLQVLQCSSVR